MSEGPIKYVQRWGQVRLLLYLVLCGLDDRSYTPKAFGWLSLPFMRCRWRFVQKLLDIWGMKGFHVYVRIMQKNAVGGSLFGIGII